MAFVARLAVLLLVIGGAAAAPAHAQDEEEPRDVIERTWFIDGGEVLVERAGDGRFVGTVLEPTRFTECGHPAGQVMWDINVTGPRRYSGTHLWWQSNDPCGDWQPGRTTWEVNDVEGQLVLRFCTTSPDGRRGPNCHNLTETPRQDADGDGLPDTWERFGVDTDEDGSIDLHLPRMGADPMRKNLFVEVDSMRGFPLDQSAIGFVVAAFGRAPVSNPDGSGGISLHVDNGPGSIMNPLSGETWGRRSKSNQVPYRSVFGGVGSDGLYDFAALDRVKRDNLDEERRVAFRYALGVDAIGSSTDPLGIARGAGTEASSDFIVAVGSLDEDFGVGATSEHGGTFMHELGHSLGLDHGGQDAVDNKPNYHSVMNTSLAGGLIGTDPDGTVYLTFDYSRLGDGGVGGPLVETVLDERTGVAAPSLSGRRGSYSCPDRTEREFQMDAPVDWNCNGRIDDGQVSVDVNDSGSAFDDLHSFADWPNLRYRGGEIGGLRLRDVQPQRVALDEPSKRQVLANRRTLTGDAGRPRVKVRVSRRRLIVTATDGKRLDRVVAIVDGKRREKVTRVARRKLVLKVRLRRGRHRVQVAAADWTGNVSRPVRRTLRVR